MSLAQNNASKLHKESGLNNKKKIKVFGKLQTQISLREANDYTNICEIFDDFLEKGFLYTHSEEASSDSEIFNDFYEKEFLYTHSEEASSDIYAFLKNFKRWILKSKESSKQVLGVIKHVFQIVIDINKAENRSNKHVENKHLESWLVLTTLISLRKIPNLIIEGTWEDVLYALLEYTRTWDVDSAFSVTSLSSQILETLKDFFCRDSSLSWFEIAYSPTLCPNPYLRLEIIRLLLMVDTDGIKFRYGLKIMTIYFDCMSIINPEKLFVIMGNNFLSMRHLMLNIYKRYDQTMKIRFHSKVVEDLHLNKMGEEVRFFANTLKVIGMFAQIAATRYHTVSRIYYLIKCLSLCLYLIVMCHTNIFSKKNIYNHKLLLPYTCCALADITDGILALFSLLNDKDFEPCMKSYTRSSCVLLYNDIVKRRNVLVSDLKIPKENFLHVKLYQREQSSYKFSNNLLVKKAALSLPMLELGTISTDKIKWLTESSYSQTFFRYDSENDTDSDDGSEEVC